MSQTFVAIRYTPTLVPLFHLLGLGPARSGVWVGRDSIRVMMGGDSEPKIPRRAVLEIGPDDAPVGGIGIHGWGARWLVNGSAAGLVRLQIKPAVRGPGYGHTGAAANFATQPGCPAGSDDPAERSPLEGCSRP